MTKNMPFIPGNPVDEQGLLSRYLPPIPEGIVAPWTENNLQSGSLVFDPFGTSPQLIIEIARAGFKVLTCVNNPIARFLLNLGANPPREVDFQSALAELAKSRVGEERLEPHLKNLYRTQCTQCGQAVIAKAFIWERDSNGPQMKIYDCQHCGDSGEYPVSPDDIDLAQSFSATSMHRMRILERITNPGDPERENVVEALSVYQPRAIYALVTLINRLEGLLAIPQKIDQIDPTTQNCLIGLVLSALDQGNNLWSYPSGRARPKRLSSSPHFLEKNIWFAIEQAVVQLASQLDSVEISIYPDDLDDAKGVIVYKGPLRKFSEEFTDSSPRFTKDISSIITAIPRHNQAYWTLSALWAGWIWGRDAIGEFKSVLRRRRYDWSWHCAALNHAFKSIASILKKNTPLFGIIAEAESSFIHSSIVAAGQAGYSLHGIGLRADSQIAQIHWKYEQISHYQITAPVMLEKQMQDLIVSNGIRDLEERGEPAPYISMHTSALIKVAENMGISHEQHTSSTEEYSRIQHLIENSLTFKQGYLRYGGSEKILENASFWHQEIIEPSSMLSDRVESEVYQHICKGDQIDYLELDLSICKIFPGIMTPNSTLINNCIESYSKKGSLQKGEICLRSQDEPARRTHEVSAICSALHDLGSQLEFKTEGDNPVYWMDSKDLVSLVFHVSSSAEVGKIVFKFPHPAQKSIIIMPGARAKLLLYKLQNNPYLAQIIDQGWRFLKFRYLRHLLESPSLDRDNLDRALSLDPMTESPAQMRLL